jgi:formylglycine-generating enzyme required for sulfatase activity
MLPTLASSLTSFTFAISSALAPAPQGAVAKPAPPPGLVWIEGGTTKIGSTVDDVMKLAEKNDSLFIKIACETPQHDLQVDDFYLMTTEVTNEQFAEFVRATGRRAPEHWAAATIDEAQAAFLLAEAEAKKKAKEAGQPYESKIFDRADWWRRNGEGKNWEIPKGKESHPVVYVNYADARAYARWAGLRLPTEFEYQRAGRGKTNALYPWGNEADGTRCANESLKLRDTQPVGSYASGATAAGVHDLSGSVFEWTSSPFSPFPRFKVLKFDTGGRSSRKEIVGDVGWDPNLRVLVGGSYETSMIVARLTTRRPTDREQSTSGVGFRCAASPRPGADIASTILSDVFPVESRPADSVFDAARALAADRWTSKPGSSSVPNYAVIAGYDHLLYIPSADLDTTSGAALLSLSLTQGFIPLGLLSTTVPVVDPPLPAGAYLVALRGATREAPGKAAGAAEDKSSAEADKDKDKGKEKDKGKGKKRDADKPQEGEAKDEPAKPAEPAAAVIRTPEGWPHDVDTLIFYRADGEPVGWMRAPQLEYVRPVAPTMTITDEKRRVTKTGEDGKQTQVEEAVSVASLKLNSPVKVSNKGFGYTLRLTFAAGAISNEWRHPKATP